MESIMPGEPYSLKPGDPKRKLIHEIARIARELKIRPVVIGGLAVNHHGYLRVTVAVDLLLSKDDAATLHRRLKEEFGWKRHNSGFWKLDLNVEVDIHIDDDQRPERVDLVHPIPVPALEDLLALKVNSDLARDDADIAELLKLRPKGIDSIHAATRKRLRTNHARLHLDEVVARAKDELARRG